MIHDNRAIIELECFNITGKYLEVACLAQLHKKQQLHFALYSLQDYSRL